MPINVNQTLIDRIEQLRILNGSLSHTELCGLAIDEFLDNKLLGNNFSIKLEHISASQYRVTNFIDPINPIVTVKTI